ncbi:ABC transporter ATP-binding protein [Eubacterium oxidoreducens]|uniref:ATP-binding cassette, subfamily B n=1 Tax=Eubacterium oxidoreducens TaxID=1732 RepID=A0A1G6BCN7_EUBOX|nr:ABC transporter ATP-binding protein [Eubacterium oxidoreducens]SDB18363.1 ATP-binding cassette, subfamily B [Eubacterium oxidoreducens]
MKVIKILLKSLREYKKPTILTMVYMVVEVAMECVIPLVMAHLINLMTADALKPIVQSGIALLIFAVISLVFGAFSGREAATASCGFAKNLRHDMYEKILSFDFADIDRFSSSSLITRMTTDVTNVQNAYQMTIRVAVRTPLMIVFSVAMSFGINPRMALIFLILLPILLFSLFGIAMVVMPIFKRIFKKYDALNNSVEENVSAIRVVKSFVREGYEIKKFGTAAEDVRKEFTHAERILAFNNPIMILCIFAAIWFVCFRGAQLIVSSNQTLLTTGDLSSLMTYGVQILASCMMLSFVFVLVSIASESMERIAQVLTNVSELKSPKNGVTDVADGSVDFENVSFRYSKKSKKAALSEINLHIKSGETIGIIGGTGSAKTTLIQLISRLYDTTEGSVKVGGVDVREYDLNTLRDAVSVVLQKNVLFSGTITENLRWGNKDATEEEIIHACQLAQADEFVQQFPRKYDTYIEQGGTNVSGGQKQRLCIARALLKKPKILIMDDSTSAVDTKTDALIRRAMRDEIPDTTKIIIAQRISSVEDADRILVMEDGKIAEIGNHQELLEFGGIYRSVYDSQTKSQEVG